MAIAHDCTRFNELASFIECERPVSRSGFMLDTYFTNRRTRAEKLEFRHYTMDDACPLFYTGACDKPLMVKPQGESFGLTEKAFPTIKAKTQIKGCDVDERRIDKFGNVTPVGRQRFDDAFNHNMMALLDGLRATHIAEAVNLLKYGRYVLSDSANSDMGVCDFGRKESLANIDLTEGGESGGLCDPCANPSDIFEGILTEMAACGGVAGAVDIHHSRESWQAMRAHIEREEIRYQMESGLTGTAQTLATGFNDVVFKGSTNGGQIRHWVNLAQYKDFDGETKPVLDAGEMLIVSGQAFGGNRVFRTVSSDNYEELATGQDLFIYDGIEQYRRECRAYEPWIEEYHLMVPTNVNGAALVKAVGEDCEPCVQCEEC
jgi:hypothetical protein